MDNIKFKNKTVTQQNFIPKTIGISTHVSVGNNNKHNHTHYEIFYVLNGKIKHIVNDKTQILGCGDCVILDTATAHSIIEIEKSSKRDIMVSVDIFEQIFNLIHLDNQSSLKKHFFMSTTLTKNEIVQFEMIAKNFSATADLTTKRCLGISLIVQIFQKFLENKAVSSKKYSGLVSRIITNLNKSNFLIGGIPAIVKDAQYSTSHIYHLFKQETGIPLSQYIKDVRLTHIAYYLQTTSLSMREICDMVGIESISYATRSFKKKYNTTPIAFRHKS